MSWTGKQSGSACGWHPSPRSSCSLWDCRSPTGSHRRDSGTSRKDWRVHLFHLICCFLITRFGKISFLTPWDLCVSSRMLSANSCAHTRRRSAMFSRRWKGPICVAWVMARAHQRSRSFPQRSKTLSHEDDATRSSSASMLGMHANATQNQSSIVFPARGRRGLDVERERA